MRASCTAVPVEIKSFCLFGLFFCPINSRNSKSRSRVINPFLRQRLRSPKAMFCRDSVMISLFLTRLASSSDRLSASAPTLRRKSTWAAFYSFVAREPKYWIPAPACLGVTILRRNDISCLPQQILAKFLGLFYTKGYVAIVL